MRLPRKDRKVMMNLGPRPKNSQFKGRWRTNPNPQMLKWADSVYAETGILHNLKESSLKIIIGTKGEKVF